MKILLLTQVLPYPPDSGPKVKTWHVLRYLAERHAVTVASFVRGDQSADARALGRHCREVHTVELRRGWANEAAALARSVRTGLPWLMLRDAQAPMRELVERLAIDTQFDVVHADQLNMCQYALGVAGTRRLFDAHNALWLLHARLAPLLPHGPLRWLLARESRLLRDYEGRMCARFDAVTAVTAEDRRALEEVSDGRADVRVVPIAVDTRALAVLPRGVPNGRVTFVGTMDWPPNADGVAWFARRAWPQVRARRPDATFEVLGARPPHGVRALDRAGSGIHVAGYVDDLGARLAGTGVFVAPLRAGGGMRVKILDALARGLPVVSTRVGCEGLAVTHERDILVADTAAELAAAVLRVLDDPALAERLAVNGRALAERVYDYREACRPLEEVYADLSSRPAKAAGSGAR